MKTLLKLIALLVALATLSACAVLALNRADFGGTPEGARFERMTQSPQWSAAEEIFENAQPLWNDTSVSNMASAYGAKSEYAEPQNPAAEIPVVKGDGSLFQTPPGSGLRVTWFGHSSLLIEVDGKRFLTDPIWGPSPFPVTWLGPQRWYAPPMPLGALPSVDAVLISHDHYDHLDHWTFEQIKDWDTQFFVPLGVGAHLEYWGVPAERIVELDWWDKREVGALEVVCAPARHASGRSLFDQNATLWAGWALLGPKHRVFFSGDTGLFDDMKRIGEELGPFDITMLEIGAYHRAWPDWHLGPEQAVQAHQWLKGDLFLPVHWGLFDLAMHGWTEPVERVLVAAEAAGVLAHIPPPGGSVEPASPPPQKKWWPEVPWESAAVHPVISTDVDGRPPRAH